MTIYNPHLLSQQELIETFVARQPLLDELLDSLRRGGGQHHLLVGSRGSGKTTLLLRLATAIELDKQLAKKCVPLRFPEEQYNVSRPSDFWMNAIDALVDALERRGDHTAANRLESTLKELEPLEEDERAKRSLTILETWTKQTKRLIVLLVDNLDLVLDRLANSLWELREALSIDNRLVVIGASSRFIEEAIDYQSPFYDFFRVHELGPLSEQEARQVVLSLAQRANSPGVAQALERDPGRFKALYVLTGGTPRTLALLHTVLTLDHGDRIDRDLESLLDQLTPYYKARFDDLPAQSQVVVDKVALHWHPITAADCQAATHLDVNVVSAQLNRLVKSGLLTKVSLPEIAKLGFQLSERFFNIWYLMRASRRLRRRLSWFVEFLRIFYGEEDIRRRAEDLIRSTTPSRLNSPAKLLAFASAVPEQPLRRQLEFRAISALAADGFAEMPQLLDLDDEDVHLVPIIDRVRALKEIRTIIHSANVRWPSGHTANAVAERLVRDPWFSLHQKQVVAMLARKGNLRPALSLSNDRPDLARYGEPLLYAISTGEVPSLADATTPDDVRQILELTTSSSVAVLDLIGATEVAGKPLSDDCLRQIARSDPDAAESIVLAADVEGNWPRARHLMSFAMAAAEWSRSFLAALIVSLRICLRSKRGQSALDLLTDAGFAERWAPLCEAFRASLEGSPTRLESLAPEMRSTALKLYARLNLPDDDSLARTPKSAAANQQPSGRRARSQNTRPSNHPARAKQTVRPK